MCHGPGVHVVAVVPAAGPVPPPIIVGTPANNASSPFFAVGREVLLPPCAEVRAGEARLAADCGANHLRVRGGGHGVGHPRFPQYPRGKVMTRAPAAPPP